MIINCMDCHKAEDIAPIKGLYPVNIRCAECATVKKQYTCLKCSITFFDRDDRWSRYCDNCTRNLLNQCLGNNDNYERYKNWDK